MFASRADLKVCSIGRPSRRVTAAEIHPRTLLSVYSSVRRASEMSVGGLTMTVSGGLREDNVREEAIRPSRRSERDKAPSPEFHGCEFPGGRKRAVHKPCSSKQQSVTTRPLLVLLTRMEFAVRFVTRTSPSSTVSFGRTRTSRDVDMVGREASHG